MTCVVKCYNLRFKTGVKFFLEEITTIPSQVLSIFIKNNGVVSRDFSYFFFELVLQMGANSASG
jgi:hypothetical protein